MNKLVGILFFFLGFCTMILSQENHPDVTFLKSELAKENIHFDEVYISDSYTSRGISHIYYKESYSGIPVYNSTGAIHYTNDGQVIIKDNLVNGVKGKVPNRNPKLNALQALNVLVDKKSITGNGEITVTSKSTGVERKQTINASEVSIRPILAKLIYYYKENGDIRLAWSLPIEALQSAAYIDYIVDAVNGEVLEEVSWTVECNHGGGQAEHCDKDHSHEEHSHEVQEREKRSESTLTSSIIVPNTYEVYEWPVESPNFGVRTVVNSPWDDNAAASPNGWHTIGSNSFTTTRGNNTDAYLDDNNSNSPTGGDAARAEGGANLEFIFPLDVDGEPTDYQDAAITNCFYWSNLMHDVWYNYGFDEASGNFQEQNYSIAGLGTDYVFSEVQDGLGTCNANFGTPPDGENPRMQMYLCNGRDGDFDNGVIAHEYGHGISNRLTGGPAAAGCLSGSEQMGEGWSDFFGMVMTIEIGDTELDPRTVGTWLFGQGPNGNGIRPYPYTTDFGVNPSTYDDIKTFSVPHGVGSVWCTMLWDLTWSLINEYGFDSDIYEGAGGNNIGMNLVMEGMKLQPCRPGFVDARDAILEADVLLYNGANQLLIWEVFAARGLGYSADQGSYTSRSDGTEAFDLPPNSEVTISKSTLDINAEEGGQITYSITITNNQSNVDEVDFTLSDPIPSGLNFVSASDGGTESGGIVTFPLFDLSALETRMFEVVLEVGSGQETLISDIYDGLESGASNWNTTSTGSTSWSLQSSVVNNGSFAYFAPNGSSAGEANLDLAVEVGLGGESLLSFYHNFDTESEFDGGNVFISVDDGQTWEDLGHRMIHNGYNSTISESKSGFSGNNEGFFNTIIDLGVYEGKMAKIRFQMSCDAFVGGNGWWIDDISIIDIQLNVLNTAMYDNGIFSGSAVSNTVEIISSPGDFEVDVQGSELSCFGDVDGTADITTTGGTGNYSYIWNDGSTSSNRSNLGAGVYRVTVSDGVESVVKVAVVYEPLELKGEIFSTYVTNATGDNGTATVLPEGGRAPFSFLWSGGETTQSVEGLGVGAYTVSVTDINMCTSIFTTILKEVECGDTFFDSGGENKEYSNEEDIVTLLCSPNPDEAIQITFNSIDIEPNWDALYIYNGNSVTSPQFSSGNGATQAGFDAGGYYGTTNPGTFISTDESGCITLRFRSDQYVTENGWDIDISCTTLCSDEVSKTTDDGWGSLRRTIECADQTAVIPVADALDMLTITVDSKIQIDKNIKLDIPSGNIYSIFMDGDEPIFEISPIGTLELDRVILKSGELDDGGAIINNGNLILNSIDVIESVDTPNPSALIQNNGQMIVKGEIKIKKE